MFDYTQIILAILALLSAIITGVLIPWIRSKTTSEQREQLAAWVRIAVTAAEQLYKGTSNSANKKQYVLAWLSAHGVDITKAEIDAIIESAVYELKK